MRAANCMVTMRPFRPYNQTWKEQSKLGGQSNLRNRSATTRRLPWNPLWGAYRARIRSCSTKRLILRSSTRILERKQAPSMAHNTRGPAISLLRLPHRLISMKPGRWGKSQPPPFCWKNWLRSSRSNWNAVRRLSFKTYRLRRVSSTGKW